MSLEVIIPARYGSTRLPGKPLIDICGLPMIVRTYRQCLEAVPKDLVFVATDDKRVASVCDTYDIPWRMTSSTCLTGTDRVAEASENSSAQTIINVQGDEPLFRPEDLTKLVEKALENPDKIINGYCEITNIEQFHNPSIPKVVCTESGRLLYMSRAAIPTDKSKSFKKGWRQVCAYAFPKPTLDIFLGRANKSPLEEIEDIEILRFLENGFEVMMIEMSSGSIAVDTPDDLERVRAKLKQDFV